MAYENISDAYDSLGRYMAFYNGKRRHQSLDRNTPGSVYDQDAIREVAYPGEALIVVTNYWSHFN